MLVSFSGKFHEFRAACLNHSEALMSSARTVLAQGYRHIAYHLAALALEEIGKREIIGVLIVSSDRENPPAWPSKHMEDHVQKLFWSFFSLSFGHEKLDKKHLDSLKDLATSIHVNRLQGLYVSGSDDHVSIPSDAISQEQAD